MSERERFLRGFHAEQAGITARAFGRGGSYARLAERVRELVEDGEKVRAEGVRAEGVRAEGVRAVVEGAGVVRAERVRAVVEGAGVECAEGVATRRGVLDLACGDGALLSEMSARGVRGVGLDMSREELSIAPLPVVQGRAQALPFRDGAFDVVVSHLAFMLFDEIEHVVDELARVLRPGGSFVALLGGGPTADGDDAFHRFLALLPPSERRFGDARAKSEAGWRTLFAGWEVGPFERWELDLGGTFEQVWAFLGTSYELPHDRAHMVRAQLAAQLGGNGRIPCRVVTWFASARSPSLR